MELGRLRETVTDLLATRVVREQVGSTTRYGDSRARRVLDEAAEAQQEAESAVQRFAAENAERLQREMLEVSENARDELLDALIVASAALQGWRRQREAWIALMPAWGISPGELPPLPGVVDAGMALQDALVDQQRAGGHARHPRLLTPAPITVQLGNPADAMRQTPGDTVPEEQRRWPREAR